MTELNVIDLSTSSINYINNLTKLKNTTSTNIREQLLESFLNKKDSNNDILEILRATLTKEKDDKNFSLIFGLENFICFSNYDTIQDFFNNNKDVINFNEKYLGERTFVIISKNTSIFYTSSNKAKELLKNLDPFFIIENKADFDFLEKISESIKINNIFIANSFEFSTVEISWMKKTFKKILIDERLTSLNQFSVKNVPIINFNSKTIEENSIFKINI